MPGIFTLLNVKRKCKVVGFCTKSILPFLVMIFYLRAFVPKRYDRFLRAYTVQKRLSGCSALLCGSLVSSSSKAQINFHTATDSVYTYAPYIRNVYAVVVKLKCDIYFPGVMGNFQKLQLCQGSWISRVESNW